MTYMAVFFSKSKLTDVQTQYRNRQSEVLFLARDLHMRSIQEEGSFLLRKRVFFFTS